MNIELVTDDKIIEIMVSFQRFFQGYHFEPGEYNFNLVSPDVIIEVKVLGMSRVRVRAEVKKIIEIGIENYE